MNLFKKHGLKIIGVFWALIVIFAIMPWGKAFFKTLIILPEFIPNSPVKTLNLFTKNPQIQEVQFKSGDRQIYGDLWLPAKKGDHPAAVLHLGVDIDPKDQRVQRLANAMARSGIATLVPDIPSLHNRRILKESKEGLIASFEYLKSHPNIKKDKVGFIAFCASGGLVLLAAEEEKIANQVGFLVTINPYFDLLSLYEPLTTRQIRDGKKIHPWRPSFKTVEIYNRETINFLVKDEKEKEILKEKLLLIGRRDLLEEGKFLPLSKEEENSLSKEAKFTYDFLTNKDSQKVNFYKENLTEVQKNFGRELSPSANIDKLKVKTFILADINNIYIPYTEAQMLDKALQGKDHFFVETKILPEGDLVQSLPPKDYILEGAKMFRFIFRVLGEIS